MEMVHFIFYSYIKGAYGVEITETHTDILASLIVIIALRHPHRILKLLEDQAGC